MTDDDVRRNADHRRPTTRPRTGTAMTDDVRLDRGFTADTIRKWLQGQRGVARGYVRLDTGEIVRDGGDADGEADPAGSALLRNAEGDTDVGR